MGHDTVACESAQCHTRLKEVVAMFASDKVRLTIHLRNGNFGAVWKFR